MGRPFKRRTTSNTDKRIVADRDKDHCIQCGIRAFVYTDKHGQISMMRGAFHHIVPLVYGGANDHTNICILCTSCHIKVHLAPEDKIKYFAMKEFYERYGRLF